MFVGQSALIIASEAANWPLVIKLFWSALTFRRKNMECTGISPDPLNFRTGDAIHPVMTTPLQHLKDN